MCVDKKQGRIACTILKNIAISEGIFEMQLQCDELVQIAKPGQFVNLYCVSDSMLLPRPISICEVDKSTGILKLVYMTMSAGTKSFTKLSAGQTVDVLGPIGNGYKLMNCEESLLIGGGVGTPPLVELAKNISGKKTIYLGFRSDPFLIETLQKYGEVHIATDDGSIGFHGTVIELMNKNGAKGQQIYACGPKPMLKALQNWSAEKRIPAQFSLEERMGCGFGACVGCVCKIKSENEFGYAYKKVCKDGPVFDAKEVLFE